MTGKKGQFGPAVIGEEAFAIEQEEVAKGIGHFGPAVVGPPEPQKPTPAQLREQPGLAALHGIKSETAPALPAAEPQPTEQAEPLPDNPQLSVAKIEDMLEASPFALDSLIELEFKRAEGPRKEAVRLFIKYEKKNLRHEAQGDVYARPDVLEILEGVLKRKSGATV